MPRAEVIADQVREVLIPPMTVDSVTVRVGASVGIACTRAGAADLPTLLRQADVAMYQAKASRRGTNTYRADSDEFASQERLRDVELLRQRHRRRRDDPALPAQGADRGRPGRRASRRWSAGCTPTVGCSSRTRSSRWSRTPG